MKVKSFAQLLIFLSLTTSAIAADPQYGVTMLTPPPGSTYDAAVSISAAGIVGQSYIGDWNQDTGVYQPTLWQGAQVTLLPVPQGDGGLANAINSTGTVAGCVTTVTTNGSVPAPAMWVGGQLQLLDTMGVSEGYTTGINDQGVVVGTLDGPAGPEAIEWVGGKATNLGLPPGMTSASAIAINNAGQVSVVANTANSSSAWVWSGGTYTQIPSLGGRGQEGYAINNTGQVAGGGYLPGDNLTAGFLYSGGITTPLAGLPEDIFIAPMGINDTGQIVGWGDDAVNSPHALLWENGQVFDLNTLIPADSGWALQLAQAIGEDGTIVGQGEFDGSLRAFELTPTATIAPEPASLTLLLLGGSLLLKRRHRLPH